MLARESEDRPLFSTPLLLLGGSEPTSSFRRSCEENHKSPVTTLYQTLIARTGRYPEQDCEAALRDMHGHASGSSSNASHRQRLRMGHGYIPGGGKGLSIF